MIGEEVPHPLREIGLIIREGMALARKDQHIKALIGFDQRVNQPHGVGRVDIVVHIAMDEQQVSLQVGRQLRVGRDADLELDFLLDLGFLFLFLLDLALVGLLVLLLLVLLGRVVTVFLFLFLLGGAGAGCRLRFLFVLLGRFLLDDDFLQTVVVLGPGIVVNVIVVVACRGDGGLEKLV